MTIQELLTESSRLGVRLEAHEGRIRYEAPRGVITPMFREALLAQKPMLLEVLWRLAAMERFGLDDRHPAPYARATARGGPGRCFSCGDALDHPEAYGRCSWCSVAADQFWASKRQADEAEAFVA